MPTPTLSEVLAEYGRDAYLLTIGKSSKQADAPASPHTSHVTVDLRGAIIGCAISESAVRNIADEPHVSLLWPPREPGGYSLIVNGVARTSRLTNGTPVAEISLTKSVVHRPGPRGPESDGPCTSDCKQIIWQA